jgi:hypothetical protein
MKLYKVVRGTSGVIHSEGNHWAFCKIDEDMIFEEHEVLPESDVEVITFHRNNVDFTVKSDMVHVYN